MTAQIGFVPSSARTTNGNSGAFKLPGNAAALNVAVNVTAVSGTTPSMTVSVQWSNDGSTWYDGDPVDALTALTAVKAAAKQFPAKGQYARLVWAITGSTPSLTFTADMGAVDVPNQWLA